MKLESLKANTSIRHEVIHPLDGPTGWIITLAGNDHPATKAALREALDRRMKRKTKLDLDEDEREGIEILAARTLDWEGLDDKPFSRDAAREVYGMEGMGWIKGQLIQAMGDEARFFTK